MSALMFDNVVPDGFAFCRARTRPGHPDARDQVGVVVDGVAFPLSAALGDSVAGLGTPEPLFARWEDNLDAVQSWADQLRGGRVAPTALAATATVLPPVAPRNVFQAAANYRRHVIELMVASPRPEHADFDETQRRAFATSVMDERAASGVPTVFSGLPSSMSGPYDEVVIPHITQQCDWELELAAVLAKPARYLSRISALDWVAGYTMVNDITMRDRLYPSGDSKRGPDWLACKTAPTFLPTGPVLVPARFVPDPSALMITLILNGETMQDESTEDMIFNLPRLLEHTSTCAELLPGDLLLTGSPAGNGVHHGRFLQAGDVMEARITGLGTQRSPVVDEPALGAR
jgi:2,4-didehydro-3-deoxy-L-rhamnonate hydrolase